MMGRLACSLTERLWSFRAHCFLPLRNDLTWVIVAQLGEADRIDLELLVCSDSWTRDYLSSRSYA